MSTLNGIPVIISPYAKADTVYIVNRGTPQAYVITDSITTITNLVARMNEPRWKRILRRLKVWLDIPFVPNWTGLTDGP